MFETQRLLVKNWTEDMAQDFFELSNDKGFTAFPITDYRQANVESARKWILNNVNKFAVIEKETTKLIGMGGLMPWKWENEDLVDITYRLRSSAQGRGLGLELAQGLLHFGFKQMKLAQITATITTDNIPSKKMAEKLGMKFDRTISLKGIPTDLYRLYA